MKSKTVLEAEAIVEAYERQYMIEAYENHVRLMDLTNLTIQSKPVPKVEPDVIADYDKIVTWIQYTSIVITSILLYIAFKSL